MISLRFMFLAFGICCVSSGCSHYHTVTVPEVHQRYVYVTDTLNTRDSIYLHDSTAVTQRGDTVRIETVRYKFRDRWMERIHNDTIIEKDTITVVKTVEKQPTGVQKWLNAVQKWLSLPRFLLVLALFFAIFRLTSHFRK